MKRKKILEEIGILLVIILLVLSTSTGMANTSEPLFANADPNHVVEPVENDRPSPIGEEAIYYYNFLDWDAVGLMHGGIFEAAIRITPDELAGYNGWWLTAARFYHNEVVTHSGVVKIYDQGSATSPGVLVALEPYIVSGIGWVKINLSTPIELDITRDIWVSIEITRKQFERPISTDWGPAVDGKGDWIYGKGLFDWQEMHDSGFSVNWNIEGIVSAKAKLEITDIKGLIGATAAIKNIGHEDATNVEWTMTVTGGILGRINKTASDTIPTITASAEETIRSGIIFGLGPISVNVTAEADNAGRVTMGASGFILGPFVIGVK